MNTLKMSAGGNERNPALEIFLAPYEVEAFVAFAVHVALDVQL